MSGQDSTQRSCKRLIWLCLQPLLLCTLVLAGCASERVQDCESIAGAGWTVLNAPPADATQLLSLQGVPVNDSIVWLGKGPNHVLACNYQIGLVSPGCSNSRAYVFERGHQGWKSNGILLSACNAEQ